MARLRHTVTLAAPLVASIVLSACGPSGSRPPEIVDGQKNVQAAVGEPLKLTIRASDPDGDQLGFSFTAEGPQELGERAQLHPLGDGSSVILEWTPLVGDVGTWHIDFEVTDGTSTVTETVEVQVTAASGRPVFIKPTNTGTTLDPEVTKCLDVEVEVQDADTADVEITAELRRGETLVPGDADGEFQSDGPSHGKWHWCPTAEQVSGMPRYTLTLIANDDQTDAVTRRYEIILQGTPPSNCSGAAPTVTHTAQNQTTSSALTIIATISDDVKVDSAVLYWSTTDPGDAPQPSRMNPAPMIDLDGQVWGADVANPAADLAPGSSKTLYYVITAKDDDDPDGSCDHLVQSPATGRYLMTVTKPSAPPACADDPEEDNDTLETATLAPIALAKYVNTGQQICAWDDDYYKFYLIAGDSVQVLLTFNQANAEEDLDLYLYGPSGGAYLTSAVSTDSDEYLEYTVSATGWYKADVYGFLGSENRYDICISWLGECFY